MNERDLCKVYTMQKGMEYQQTQAFVSGLYLPTMLEQRKKAQRYANVKSVVKGVVKVAFRILIGLLTGFITAAWAIPATYEERGYDAYGGEYLLILAVITLTIYLTGKGMKKGE